MACLNEHAGRTTGWIQHLAVVWFDHIHDHAHQAGRSEEFAALLCACLGKLVQEVFIDAAKNITGSFFQNIAVEDLDQLRQQFRFKDGVATGQCAFEHLVILFDQIHGVIDFLA